MALYTKPRWTESETEWLIENYPLLGSKFCAFHLEKSGVAIRAKARALGLKADLINLGNRRSQSLKGRSRPEISGVDIDQFYLDFNPYSSYFLGFLWADGYLYNNNFLLENTKEDLDSLAYIFNHLGTFTTTERTRDGRKPQKRIQFSSQKLFKILQEWDYVIKSSASADKILSHIPRELHKYWFMGLIDGDGCFYFNAKNKCRQFTMSSNYDQDWNYFEVLCQELGIKYFIQRTKKKNGNQSSSLRFFGKGPITKLGNYLYTDSLFNGLPRKHQKYLDIIN